MGRHGLWIAPIGKRGMRIARLAVILGGLLQLLVMYTVFTHAMAHKNDPVAPSVRQR